MILSRDSKWDSEDQTERILRRSCMKENSFTAIKPRCCAGRTMRVGVFRIPSWSTVNGLTYEEIKSDPGLLFGQL